MAVLLVRPTETGYALGEATWETEYESRRNSKKLEENRETIRGLGVRLLRIFGSYARDEQKEASDMDFLVEFDEATLQSYLDLKEFLQGLFGPPVDLVFADTVKPRLKPIILNEVVYA